MRCAIASEREQSLKASAAAAAASPRRPQCEERRPASSAKHYSDVGVEQVKHWIRSRTAFYIAARDAGLVELVESESLYLN
jgi:hypothetical protein